MEEELEKNEPLQEELPAEELPEETAQVEESELPEDTVQPEEKEEYTPRPLSLRIFAWVLAILVIIGLALYYYHIFIGR